MNIRCIKQVREHEDVYFEENVVYTAKPDSNNNLYAEEDENGFEHLVAHDDNDEWENDEWFYEHFRIM